VIPSPGKGASAADRVRGVFLSEVRRRGEKDFNKGGPSPATLSGDKWGEQGRRSAGGEGGAGLRGLPVWSITGNWVGKRPALEKIILPARKRK